jgi:hypothetical protein
MKARESECSVIEEVKSAAAVVGKVGLLGCSRVKM